MNKTICGFLLTLLLTFFVSANVPAPFIGGYAGIEPAGLENLNILSEKITIDMFNLGTYRTTSDKNAVNLELLFDIENKDAERKLELIFPTIKSSRFYLDDAEIIPTIAKNSSQIVVGWDLPRKTLWFEGKQLDYAAINRSDCSECSIYSFKFPNGRHKLKITQELTPSSNVSGVLTKYWQFSYTFLPSEKRAKIAKTDIEIKTPQGWQTFISPDIESGGTWQKSFEKTAEIAITITTKMPVPYAYQNAKNFSEYLFWAVIMGFPLICSALCWFFLAHSKLWWLFGILFTFLWSMLTIITIYISEFTPENFIPDAQQLNYGYGEIGSIFLMIIFGAATFVIGFPLWLGVWFLARNLKKQTV